MYLEKGEGVLRNGDGMTIGYKNPYGYRTLGMDIELFMRMDAGIRIQQLRIVTASLKNKRSQRIVVLDEMVPGRRMQNGLNPRERARLEK